VLARQKNSGSIARNYFDLQRVRTPDLILHIHRLCVVDGLRETSDCIQPNNLAGTALHAELSEIALPGASIGLDYSAGNPCSRRTKPGKCFKTGGNENCAADTDDAINLFPLIGGVGAIFQLTE
jgi:hypothetical protein